MGIVTGVLASFARANRLWRRIQSAVEIRRVEIILPRNA